MEIHLLPTLKSRNHKINQKKMLSYKKIRNQKQQIELGFYHPIFPFLQFFR